MSRNLYILAGTLFFFALISFALMWVPSSYQPGLPGNGSMWKTGGFFLLLGGLVVALAGSLTALFEQLERRAEERRIRDNQLARGKLREFPARGTHGEPTPPRRPGQGRYASRGGRKP
jgi:hypothetical protein